VLEYLILGAAESIMNNRILATANESLQGRLLATREIFDLDAEETANLFGKREFVRFMYFREADIGSYNVCHSEVSAYLLSSPHLTVLAYPSSTLNRQVFC